MKQIFKSFYTKSGTNPNSVIFLYNGNEITDGDSTFGQLANIIDKKRNKMNILVASKQNDSPSQFIFEKVIGFDESMKDFAKMVILLAMKEYHDNDDEKCTLISAKFEERYGGFWSCSLNKIGCGSSIFYYFGYFIRIKYDNYLIRIAKTHE